MISTTALPPVRDLVLIGGGHAHVGVLRNLAMRPLDGVRVTVVAREVHTPYSGMLPGYVAGHYDYDGIHIDLGPLTLAAGARLIAADARGLDLRAGRIELVDRPPLRFDVVSLNCGAVPDLGMALPPSAIAVKPIGQFLPRWHALLTEIEARDAAVPPFALVIVGAGPGGIELALAVHHAIATRTAGARITVVTDAGEVLAGHNRRVQRRFERLLAERSISLMTDFHVERLEPASIVSADGRILPTDAVLVVTGVAAPRWLRDSGLSLDPDGFVRVDERLRSVSDERVFAAGDVAALDGQPRPKAGVFAVREGPVLAQNLRRATLGEARLRRYRAQRKVLALISEGDRSATASRGAIFAAGRLMWRWKDWIDRRFMTRFQRVRPMAAPARVVPTALAASVPDPMRCGGCGAKLGADVLTETFARLAVAGHPRLALGIGDDAALLDVGERQIAVTVDGLRKMLDDPYEFGRIVTRHALSDVFAMGADPVSVLALVGVPLMATPLMRDELFQVMSGVLAVLGEERIALAGGHSSESLELTLGLTVIGDVRTEPLLKGGLATGDALILTRRLGSGVLLAAQARGLSRTRWLRAALAEMDISNRSAAETLRRHGARACTDVTGFGLLGHLAEMLSAARLTAELSLAAMPFYDGAVAMAQQGVASSLQPDNARILERFSRDAVAVDDARLALLVDPQTAGGLLAGVPASVALDCVAALKGAGYRDAVVIGRVTTARDDLGVIRG